MCLQCTMSFAHLWPAIYPITCCIITGTHNYIHQYISPACIWLYAHADQWCGEHMRNYNYQADCWLQVVVCLIHVWASFLIHLIIVVTMNSNPVSNYDFAWVPAIKSICVCKMNELMYYNVHPLKNSAFMYVIQSNLLEIACVVLCTNCHGVFWRATNFMCMHSYNGTLPLPLLALLNCTFLSSVQQAESGLLLPLLHCLPRHPA